MGNRRFSATTFVLVVVLFGALLLAGHMVNPPPPGPPEPPKPPPTQAKQFADKDSPSGKTGKAMMADYKARMKQMVAQMRAMKAHMPSVKNAKPMQDPYSMQTTSDWFRNTDMGAQGLHQADKRQEELMAEYKKLHPPLSAPPKPALGSMGGAPAMTATPMPAPGGPLGATK